MACCVFRLEMKGYAARSGGPWAFAQPARSPQRQSRNQRATSRHKRGTRQSAPQPQASSRPRSKNTLPRSWKGIRTPDCRRRRCTAPEQPPHRSRSAWIRSAGQQPPPSGPLSCSPGRRHTRKKKDKAHKLNRLLVWRSTGPPEGAHTLASPVLRTTAPQQKFP